MTKFIVFGKFAEEYRSSWELDSPEAVAEFLVDADPKRHEVFVKAEGLDFAGGKFKMARQLQDMALDTDTSI
jgi:hypothetical protein